MEKLFFKSKFSHLFLRIIVSAAFTVPITFGYSTAYGEVAGHVVISEVYGGGGNSGSAYKSDFIELYNPTDITVSLSGWSVQYATSTGTFNNISLLSGNIAPHHYYLIREYTGSGGTTNLPTPDIESTINLNATNGKIALSNTTASVSGSTDSHVIDFIGYGSANDYETSPSAALSNTKSAVRKDNNGSIVEGRGNGWDTNNNSSDFVSTTTITPENSSSPAEPQMQSQEAPILSNIQSINTTANSVTITWTTNQPCNSDVDYGTTSSYGNIASGVSNTTSHSVYITGLTANTTYHYKVKSTNSNSQTTLSEDYIFTTQSTNSSYNCYFGQLHSHTSNSDGKGTYSDAYTYARDVAHLDFFAVTDHSNYFDNYSDWTLSQKWSNIKNTANSFNADGIFVAIAGFEMTWSDGTGHMNTFNTDWFESRLTPGMDLNTYYNKIAADTGSISQWNHPGTLFGDFNNFANYSMANNNVIKLIEVANGEGVPGGSYYHPSYSYYTTALDKGWHVAPSNNEDNHNTNWGTSNDCRTVVLAPTLTKGNIFDAIRNLRVYSSEDKDLKISYSINNSIMGSTLSNPSILNVYITAIDSETTDKINKIELISDGGVVSASSNFSSNSISWNPQLTSKYKYYYIRVTETDGDIAITAPIWTGQ